MKHGIMDKNITTVKIVTTSELGYFLNLSTRRIQQLAKAGVIPAGYQRGKFNLVLCTWHYIHYLRNRLSTFSGMQVSRADEKDIK